MQWSISSFSHESRSPPLKLCVQFPQEFISCTVMLIFYKIKLIHSFHKHRMKVKASVKHGAQSLFSEFSSWSRLGPRPTSPWLQTIHDPLSDWDKAVFILYKCPHIGLVKGLTHFPVKVRIFECSKRWFIPPAILLFFSITLKKKKKPELLT